MYRVLLYLVIISTDKLKANQQDLFCFLLAGHVSAILISKQYLY